MQKQIVNRPRIPNVPEFHGIHGAKENEKAHNKHRDGNM